ncbi:MFS general substrate transporter [Rhizodiscina lignyota]|uniref:MFS general substrate transporter n=1 Tax=Rhizodiscina lignyota TaxID=1504668 RepID=A0A9P4I408_9PEZI|nr:MFS general substrate transporter [Rhizodiscina lignyota]
MAPNSDDKIGEAIDVVERSTSVAGLPKEVEYFIDPAEDKRVIRKIDWVVMPTMMLVLFFQYLDKQSINYATVFSMNKDLGLTGQKFSWVVTTFYFGQLVSQYISAYFISRFHVVRVVGITILLWGVCEMCMGATQNFAGIATTRFFLGLCEGAVSPGFVVITSNWYKRREHPIRIAIWTTSGGLATICGAVLMYLVGGAKHMAIANWRVMFLICGGSTLLIGVAFLFVMPLDTTKAWFLDENERRIATERLALDRTTRDRAEFSVSQVKETLRDPATWFYFLMALFICIPSPILKFSSLVINGFGFSPFQTMLVGLPSGGVQILSNWVAAYGMIFTKGTRAFWGMFFSLVPLVGSITLLCLPKADRWGIVVSTWLAADSSSLMVISECMMASNVKGNTKKSVVSAVFFVAYCVGCIIGPQLWQAQDAPRYTKGCISSIVSWSLLVITYLGYYFYLRGQNKKRTRLIAISEESEIAEGKTHDHLGVEVDSDMTDRQDLKFLYTL